MISTCGERTLAMGCGWGVEVADASFVEVALAVWSTFNCQITMVAVSSL